MDLFWYDTLNKPLFTPPDMIFAPTWTILYLLIALSFYIFIKEGFSKEKILPVFLFTINILLNLSWSPVFFNLKEIGLALIIAIFMLISLLLVMISFYKFSKIAIVLLIPYLLWLSFAIYLNIGFLVLN